MTRPEAVIFDVDGTLVDTVDLHAEAWVEILRRFGVDATFDEIRRQIGKGGDQLLPGLVPPDLLAQKQQEMEDARAELFTRDYLDRAKPFPGVRGLFERIRSEGQRIALASSGKADEVAHYKEVLGIADLLDVETTADDGDRSKPFPDIFDAAFRKLGLPDRRLAMVVGDTPYDAEAARGADLASLGVLCGGFPERALRAAGCVAVYRDPAHLLEAYADSPLARG
ncbi:HAD family hydrolase [Rubellimicrobium arenae]|uniref:HAD family hydrolase n=1 Tax=Rubellimicrobium arenae TaxID=2817372 RepID=UPI001B3126AC|nr:HAD family hydrolase [Rubellimicrobium arenae]